MEIIYNSFLIIQDFFAAFGLFTIFYFITSIFIKNEKLKRVDEETCSFISFVGILYVLVWIIGLVAQLNMGSEEERVSLWNRMFGKYWFGYWTQPLLWILITQLLRFKRVRKNIFMRLLFSFFLMISIEAIVILIISLHRDYLPSSFRMYSELDIYPSSIILNMTFKIIIFLIFVGVFYFIKRKIKIKSKQIL